MKIFWRFMRYVPLMMPLAFFVLAWLEPAILSPFIPYTLTALLRTSTLLLVLAIIFSRIKAHDYIGWSVGYMFTACSILGTMLIGWHSRAPGGINSILAFLAALAWYHSSITQFNRTNTPYAVPE